MENIEHPTSNFESKAKGRAERVGEAVEILP
jgi:hypothetical protein